METCPKQLEKEMQRSLWEKSKYDCGFFTTRQSKINRKSHNRLQRDGEIFLNLEAAEDWDGAKNIEG